MVARKTGPELKTPDDACIRRPARERIFETAKELFYQHGIRAVGVDAIAASADATKMTLYRNFPSKDELVAEILREQVKEYWEWWDDLIASHPDDPRAQLQAVLDGLSAEACCDENSYGCALANAAIELHDEAHPARRVAVEHRRELRRRFVELARQAGAKSDELADGLMLLIEGAWATRATLGFHRPAVSVSSVGRTIIDAYLPPK